MPTSSFACFRSALASLFVMSLATGTLGAQSFDCRRAQTPLERRICSDPALGAADVSLNQAWRAAIATFPVPALLRLSQRYWLRGIAGCLSVDPGACLTGFRERTQFLREIGLAKVYASALGEVSPDQTYLAFFRTGRGPALWVFGAYMPDMNDPQPPPDGYLYDDVYELRAESGNRFRIVDLDGVMQLSAEQIVFPEYIMISPRQGGLNGRYRVMR